MSSSDSPNSSSSAPASSDSSAADQANQMDWNHQPWRRREPIIVVQQQQQDHSPNNSDAEADDIFNPQDDTRFCRCRHANPIGDTARCVDWHNANMNICCMDHTIIERLRPEEVGVVRCICDAQDIQDLMKEAPLRLMFQNFSANHPQRYPDGFQLQPNARWSAEQIKTLKNKQLRLSAYRSMVFWAFPNIRRKQRKPLPSCIYMMIRAMYPPTDDEEAFADTDFTRYIPEADDEEP